MGFKCFAGLQFGTCFLVHMVLLSTSAACQGLAYVLNLQITESIQESSGSLGLSCHQGTFHGVPSSHEFQKILLTTLAKLFPNIELSWIIFWAPCLCKDEYFFPWSMTLQWGCLCDCFVLCPVITALPDPLALLQTCLTWLQFPIFSGGVPLQWWPRKCTKTLHWEGKYRKHLPSFSGIVAFRAGVSILFPLFSAIVCVHAVHSVSVYTGSETWPFLSFLYKS